MLHNCIVITSFISAIFISLTQAFSLYQLKAFNLVCKDDSLFNIHLKNRNFYKFNRQSAHSVIMLDASTASVYFNINDNVRVVKNVFHYPKSKQKFSSLGLIGQVVSVWDKCEGDVKFPFTFNLTD